MDNKANKIFLFWIFISITLQGWGQMEHRISVRTDSKAYRAKSINIDSITHGMVTHQMFYSLQKLSSNNSSNIKIIWKDSSAIYAFEQCQFKVLQWKDSGWVNLYNNNNKGWCIGNYYIDEKNILGFTGSGFWTSQGALYQFTSSSGSWEIINTSFVPNLFFSGGDFRIGNDTLVSSWGFTNIQGAQKSSELLSTFGLCLRTNTWFKIKNNIKLKRLVASAWGGITFDFEKSSLIVGNHQIIQVDKKSRNVYRSEGNSLSQNKIEFFYNDCVNALILHDAKYITIFPQSVKNLIPLGKITFEKILDNKNSKTETIEAKKTYFGYLIVVVVLLTSGLLFWFFKTKPTKNNDIELLNRIKENTGKIFNAEEIDQVLGINPNMSQDSKRVKRSRMIKLINEEYRMKKGRKLIDRQRDEKDSRYMLYRIEK